MIPMPAGTRIWVTCGTTDMRKGFDSLASLVESSLALDPLSGHLFVFRSRRGDRIKVLWWDRDGYCLWYKRLEKGCFRLERLPGGKRPALPAFHTPLTHEIVCSLTGKLRGTHDERYGTFRS